MSILAGVDLTRLAILLVVGLAIAACSTTARDQAVIGCRQAGYLGATQDAGLWYCFKDRLGGPQVVPKTP